MGTSCCKQHQPENELKTDPQDTDVLLPNEPKDEYESNPLANMTKESLETEIKTLDFKEVAPKKVSKKERTEQEIEFLHYNKLTAAIIAEIAEGLLKNPDLEYNRLKKASKEFLEKGKEALLNDNYIEAKTNFVLAYQYRCCCDWIWTHKLYDKGTKKVGRPGDPGHAVFVQK